MTGAAMALRTDMVPTLLLSSGLRAHQRLARPQMGNPMRVIAMMIDIAKSAATTKTMAFARRSALARSLFPLRLQSQFDKPAGLLRI